MEKVRCSVQSVKELGSVISSDLIINPATSPQTSTRLSRPDENVDAMPSISHQFAGDQPVICYRLAIDRINNDRINLEVQFMLHNVEFKNFSPSPRLRELTEELIGRLDRLSP